MIENLENLSPQQLVGWLTQENENYRRGDSGYSDAVYDRVKQRLVDIDPNNPYFLSVEPEPAFSDKKVTHTKPMLSLEKVYEKDDIQAFIRRVCKAASEIGIDHSQITFRATAKLDGIAAKRQDGTWATRGDGLVGSVINDKMESAGIVCLESSNPNPVGEIVMLKSYAKATGLADARCRNIVAGILSADNLKYTALAALKAGAVHFVPFDKLDSIAFTGTDWENEVAVAESSLQEQSLYPTDGIVISVENPELKDYMGENSREPRYAVAKKTNDQGTLVTVEKVTWQLGRTGKMTPVVHYPRTEIGGVINSKATGHSAGSLKKLGIGTGAKILTVRSGAVIPFIVKCVEPVEASIPTDCPSCGSSVAWTTNEKGERVFLECTNNIDCPDQLREKLRHFFHTIKVKEFGHVACEKLIKVGLDTPIKVYRASEQEFMNIGFGAKQSENLKKELVKSLTEPVNDYALLAAFGISGLGRGDAKKILKNYDISDALTLSSELIQGIAGFGSITGDSISNDLNSRANEIREILSLGFNLTPSMIDSQNVDTSASWYGTKVVFTGKLSLSRSEMQKEAELLGLTVQKSLSRATQWLVAGENSGQSKLNKAESNGVLVLNEQQYRGRIS